MNFQEVVHSAQTENADVAKQKRFAEDRIHKNARLTPKGREEMVRAVVEGGLSKAAAARRYNTTAKTVAKWVDRFRKEGADGLHDRSSRPHSSPDQTPQPTCDAVEALRRARYTGKQIAHQPAEPLRRYERERPGELVHIDIKKLGRFNQIGHRITGDRRGQSNGRGVGWEYVHVCIDDHSRVAFAKIMSDEKRRSAIAFLKAALAYYASLGIKVERVMTDNGSCYRSFAFRRACKRLGLKHIRTKPYTPKTNGKAERFIQTSLREWAYAQAYETSHQRKDQLPAWLQLA